MKTRIILLVAISAIVTLSFTFTNIGKSTNTADKNSQTTTGVSQEPAGGFVSEDKF